MNPFQKFHPGFDQTRLQKLSALAPEVAQRITQTAVFSAIQALSGQPLNPYERLKLQYFDKDYKFPTIDNIVVPDDYDPVEYAAYIADYQKNLTTTMHQQVSCYGTIMSESSSVNCMVQQLTAVEPFKLSDIDIKNNIRYNEFIKTIKIEDVYNNPIEVNEKIVTFFVNNLKQKY